MATPPSLLNFSCRHLAIRRIVVTPPPRSSNLNLLLRRTSSSSSSSSVPYVALSSRQTGSTSGHRSRSRLRSGSNTAAAPAAVPAASAASAAASFSVSAKSPLPPPPRPSREGGGEGEQGDATPRHQPPPRPSDPATAPKQAPPTDLAALDVLGNTPIPSTSVDVCHADGFTLNSGVYVGSGSGALLVAGEAFEWRPWYIKNRLLNEKGQWEVEDDAWGVLGMVWPRPDLLILGLGPEIRPLSPKTRQAITKLGIRVEVLDTRNAASQYNLLATERGVDNVAAALVPIGWKEGVGAV